MMERFGIARVFGMHNMPGLPVGRFAIRPGPIMAATAEFTITVKGKGGHAAMPHATIDPIVIASQMVQALQTIASRTIDPIESIVVSVTKFHAGDAYNVIPQEAPVRRHHPHAEHRTSASCRASACARSARASPQPTAPPSIVDLDVNYPVTFNDPAETVLRQPDRGATIAGEANVDTDVAAGDGRRGFLLHAGGAPRRLHLHRQWRHRRPPQPRLRLQRRGHSARHQLLGEARRNRPRAAESRPRPGAWRTRAKASMEGCSGPVAQQDRTPLGGKNLPIGAINLVSGPFRQQVTLPLEYIDILRDMHYGL